MYALSFIRSSWDFFRRQPALASVAVWMFFVPMLGMDALGSLRDGDRIPSDIAAEASIGIVVLTVLLAVVTIWGQCCVFVAGKRMLQTKAGRTRTSFMATASQAKAFIIPFILTHILRGCLTFLWALLLIVPGIVYALRTVFTPVVVVGENTAYRAALNRSKAAVKGNSWKILGTLVLLALYLYGIPMALITVASLPLPQEQAWSYAAVYVVGDAWYAVALTLFSLCLIQMYEKYRAPLPR